MIEKTVVFYKKMKQKKKNKRKENSWEILLNSGQYVRRCRFHVLQIGMKHEAPYLHDVKFARRHGEYPKYCNFWETVLRMNVDQMSWGGY